MKNLIFILLLSLMTISCEKLEFHTTNSFDLVEMEGATHCGYLMLSTPSPYNREKVTVIFEANINGDKVTIAVPSSRVKWNIIPNKVFIPVVKYTELGASQQEVIENLKTGKPEGILEITAPELCFSELFIPH